MKIEFLILFVTQLKVATCQQFLSKDVALYINRQIDKLLQQNPAKEVIDLKIDTEFNEQRKRLQNAKFNNINNVTEAAEYQTEQTRRNFLKFAVSFKEVANQLEIAFQEIENIQRNKLMPLSTKYKALTLKNKLQASSTIKEAESNLKRYQTFKQATVADSNNPYLALAQENRKYFEEILKELKNHTLCETNSVESPLKIQTCAEVLGNLREKNADYEVYEIDAADLFDAVLGL